MNKGIFLCRCRHLECWEERVAFMSHYLRGMFIISLVRTLNCASASSLLSWFLSGCHLSAIFLYAFLISDAVAVSCHRSQPQRAHVHVRDRPQPTAARHVHVTDRPQPTAARHVHVRDRPQPTTACRVHVRDQQPTTARHVHVRIRPQPTTACRVH
eukprot:1184287-Prorocentrum_minimum.AAC.1